MSPFNWAGRKLTSGAQVVLGQLFVNGPIWDGNIVSKSGREELVKLQLAKHEHGFAFLTSEGVQTAVEWGDFAAIDPDLTHRWLHKKCGR